MKHVVRVLNRFRETFWSTMKWACILREYRFNYSIVKYKLYYSCGCLIRWKRANSIPIIDYDWWNDFVSHILSVYISCEVLFLRIEKMGIRKWVQHWKWTTGNITFRCNGLCVHVYANERKQQYSLTIFSPHFLVYLFICELEIWRLYNI